MIVCSACVHRRQISVVDPVSHMKCNLRPCNHTNDGLFYLVAYSLQVFCTSLMAKVTVSASFHGNDGFAGESVRNRKQGYTGLQGYVYDFGFANLLEARKVLHPRPWP